MRPFGRNSKLELCIFGDNGGDDGGDSANMTPLAELVAQSSQPTYVYNLAHIRERYSHFAHCLMGAGFKIHYAVKANGNAQVLRTLKSLGSGIDTVSGGEIQIALNCGYTPSDIIFSGVGKSQKEIEMAVSLQIKQINVESPSELKRIIATAMALGKKADVAFRMNPNVNPQTHPYITTGFRENKFGMDESFLPELKELWSQNKDVLNVRGLTMHIGSQLLDLKAWQEALEKTGQLLIALRSLGMQMDRFDVGGGIGINYDSDDETIERDLLKQYGKSIVAAQVKFGVKEIMCEPGRWLVGRAGMLLTQVEYIKNTPVKSFAIVNTGMHHLIRPALYQAKHRVLELAPRKSSARPYDVVGPICESSDWLARDVQLSIQEGDWLAFADAGAYGYSMASQYNAHALPHEITWG